MNNLIDIITFGWPHSDYRLGISRTLDDLEWLDPNTLKPTATDIQTVSDKMDALAYRSKRVTLYPSIDDLADAMVHQREGDGGVALEAYFQRCIAVKTQFPKPS